MLKLQVLTTQGEFEDVQGAVVEDGRYVLDVSGIEPDKRSHYRVLNEEEKVLKKQIRFSR